MIAIFRIIRIECCSLEICEYTKIHYPEPDIKFIVIRA
jgi:hypothetical protein